MLFSLLNVYSTNPDGLVTGTWVQDHIGTLETAREAAKRTEEVNGNKIFVAVVKDLGPYPSGVYENIKRLA